MLYAKEGAKVVVTTDKILKVQRTPLKQLRKMVVMENL